MAPSISRQHRRPASAAGTSKCLRYQPTPHHGSLPVSPGYSCLNGPSMPSRAANPGAASGVVEAGLGVRHLVAQVGRDRRRSGGGSARREKAGAGGEQSLLDPGVVQGVARAFGVPLVELPARVESTRWRNAASPQRADQGNRITKAKAQTVLKDRQDIGGDWIGGRNRLSARSSRMNSVR